jgi:hypothetical protein
VIQEIPDCGMFFNEVSTLLGSEGRAIIVTVHPLFAEWLKESRRFDTVFLPPAREKHADWRWAAPYPIVDEPLETFYLPYFHRSIEDYISIASSSGLSVEEIHEIPDKDNRLDLVSKGISPFKDFKQNLYWPGIADTPSSLILVLRREQNNG